MLLSYRDYGISVMSVIKIFNLTFVCFVAGSEIF